MNYCPNCGINLDKPSLPKNVVDLINKTMRDLPVNEAVADRVIKTSLLELHKAIQAGFIKVAQEALSSK